MEPERPDKKKVKEVARLARIAISDAEAERLTADLNRVLDLAEKMKEIDVAGIEPMTSVINMRLKTRADVVSDGNIACDVLCNAPQTRDGMFAVPRILEADGG